MKSSFLHKCSVTSLLPQDRTFQAVHSTPRNLHGEIVQSVEKPLAKPPESIHKEDLPDLFEPLLQYMHAMITTSEEKQNYVHSKSTASASQAKISKYLVTTTLHGQIVQTGSIIKVKWTKDDIGNTGWRPGWYKAHTDEIEVVCVSEPTCIYTLEVTPAISSGIVQVVKPYH